MSRIASPTIIRTIPGPATLPRLWQRLFPQISRMQGGHLSTALRHPTRPGRQGDRFQTGWVRALRAVDDEWGSADQLMRTIFQSWSSTFRSFHWTTEAPSTVEDWATPAWRPLLTFLSS